MNTKAEDTFQLTKDNGTGTEKLGSKLNSPTDPTEKIVTYPDFGIKLGVLGGTVLTIYSLFLVMILLSAVIYKISKTDTKEEKEQLISRRKM